MTKSSKLTKRRLFRGNQHYLSVIKKNNLKEIPVKDSENVVDTSVSGDPNPTCVGLNQPRPSASKRKLTHVSTSSPGNTSIPTFNEVQKNYSGKIVIDMEILSDFISRNTRCKGCGGDISIAELPLARKGLACKLEIQCSACKFSDSTMTSAILRDRLYSVNVSLVYGLRAIGKGLRAAQMLCCLMDLPKPVSNFSLYNKKISQSLQEVSTASMKNAANEAKELNESKDIAGALDGTWHKRGHTSLNGVMALTSVDTGKVIDVEIMSKYCQTCGKSTNNTPHLNCKKNYSGTSGGMEVTGAVEIFKRSEQTRSVRYVKYLGDGDSKGFKKVVEEEPYGKGVTITKLECVGHVQKRMGAKLRRLRKEMKGEKLEDGKGLSGRGRLTDSEIDNLQLYYGLAIRRNSEDVKAMAKDIWAIYFHKLSTDENQQHGLCPPGETSWCKFNNAIAVGSKYEHKHSLPSAVMQQIKPIFQDLTKEDLLKKCTHGKTQNPNESFNAVIWTRIPKTVYVGLDTLRFGVYDAVICFNDGVSARQQVLEHLGMKVGENTKQGFALIDTLRVKKAEDAMLAVAKLARVHNRNKRRSVDDVEDPDDPLYGAGLF